MRYQIYHLRRVISRFSLQPNIRKYQEYLAARSSGWGCTICASAHLSFVDNANNNQRKDKSVPKKVKLESQIFKHHYGHNQCQQLRPFMSSFLYLLGHWPWQFPAPWLRKVASLSIYPRSGMERKPHGLPWIYQYMKLILFLQKSHRQVSDFINIHWFQRSLCLPRRMQLLIDPLVLEILVFSACMTLQSLGCPVPRWAVPSRRENTLEIFVYNVLGVPRTQRGNYGISVVRDQ